MSRELIHASYVVWGSCIVVFILCLVYDYFRSKSIQEGLQKDYGMECCKTHRRVGTDNSPESQRGELGGEGEEI